MQSMQDKHIAVFGIYMDRHSVEQGVDRLKSDGFSNTDISVLIPEQGGSDQFAHEKSTKAPEGVAAGSGTGLVIGGTLGWLIGIGALAIPGVGPFIAAGPILALLAGAGTGAALGGLTGGLLGLGIPEYEAKRYETSIKEGGILLSVHAQDDDSIERAKLALEQTGAKDISSSREVTGNSRTMSKVNKETRTSL